MRSRRYAIRSRPGNAALVQPGLEDHESLPHSSAYDLPQAGHDLPIGRLLGGFEEECSTAEILGGFPRQRGSEEVEDPIIIDLVHGDDNSVIGVLVGIDSKVADIRQVR